MVTKEKALENLFENLGSKTEIFTEESLFNIFEKWDQEKKTIYILDDKDSEMLIDSKDWDILFYEEISTRSLLTSDNLDLEITFTDNLEFTVNRLLFPIIEFNAEFHCYMEFGISCKQYGDNIFCIGCKTQRS